MAEPPTVYDVAERAGVSTATVSRVMSDAQNVRGATKQRVLDAVAELGYLQSAAAKGLARNRSHILGLTFPDDLAQAEQSDASFWYDELIRGAERAARQAGYMLLIAGSPSEDYQRVFTGVAGSCDGIVTMSGSHDPDTLARVSARKPVVVIGSGSDKFDNVDHVLCANREGAYELTAHLCDVHGVVQPGYVAGGAPDSYARFAGFRAALRDRGLKVPRKPIAVGDLSTPGGRRVGESLVDNGLDVDALVCVNDQTAIGLIESLVAAGIRVPGQVRVTGFDGVVFREPGAPLLTTSTQSMQQMGALAAELLVERLNESRTAPVELSLDTTLRIGDTCGCDRPALVGNS